MTTQAQISTVQADIAKAITDTGACTPPTSALSALAATLATAKAQAAALMPTPVAAPPPATPLTLEGSVLSWPLPAAMPEVDGTAIYFNGSEAISSNWANGNPTSIDLSQPLNTTLWEGALPTFSPGVAAVTVEVKCYGQLGQSETFSNEVTYTPPTTYPIPGWFHDAPDAFPSPLASGHKQGIALDYAYPNANGGSNSYTQAAAQAYTNQGLRLMLKVGLLTIADATAIAQELVAGGQANAIIPIMWEGNQDVQNWFQAWNELDLTASAFVSRFNAICAAMRAVPGADFLYVWNPNVNNAGNQAAGRTQFDTAPGPAKDVILAVDGYDWPQGQGSVASNVALTQQYITWAAQNGYVFGGLCEWGCNGWDDEAYITATLQLMEQAGALFQVYFSDSGSGNLDSQLSDKPNSLAAFKAAA